MENCKQHEEWKRKTATQQQQGCNLQLQGSKKQQHSNKQ
jgi:hypothetical protein